MAVDDRVDAGETELSSRVDDAARLSRRDPEAARAELESIIAAAQRAGATAVSARALYALARVLVTLGSAERALGLIDEAERAWQRIEAVDEAIRVNLGRMHVLDELGRHTEAAAVGRDMLAHLEERGDDDDVVWLRAAAEENLGVALGYVGRHAEALDAYDAAASSYARLGLAPDAARALANRGVELTELARPAEAIDALERADAQFRAVGDLLWQALCQTNLSDAWTSAGRYLEAFRCLDTAESALSGLDRTTEWLRAQLARARCLESLHLDIEALDLYERLVVQLQAAGLVGEAGRAQLGLGTILARSGSSLDEARGLLRSAIAAFESTGDNVMVARACLEAARIDEDPAALIGRAVELLAAGERPAELALAHLEAVDHSEDDDPERAAAALEAARCLIEPLGVPELRWRLHHRAGRLLRRTGDRPGARREHEAAIAVLNSIRSSVDRDGIRQHFDGVRRVPVDDLIELLLDMDLDADAFIVAESTRSAGLVERLQVRERWSPGGLPDELHSTYDRLLTARGTLADELAVRARRLERRLVSQAPITARAHTERRTLPTNTVVFQICGNEVLAFVGDQGGDAIATRRLADLNVIERLLGALDSQMRRCADTDLFGRHRAQLEESTIAVLGDLHDVLIAPVLGELSPETSLTLVPDGMIGAVPISALHDGRSFLVERQAVRQTPSIGVDEMLRTRRRDARAVLAIGTSDESAPLAAVEAERIGSEWSSATVYARAEAIAAPLFESAADHDVIHLAGHGLFRPDAPEFSAIRLADRWITAAEITQLRLDGQVVILSACDSGRRTLDLQARDTLGLPRAFLAAGAGAVIVNLWPTDDEANVELMSALHHELASGSELSDALRAAQLQEMSRHRHPYFWGATTLIGGGADSHEATLDHRRLPT